MTEMAWGNMTFTDGQPKEPFKRFCWTCHGMQDHSDGKVTPPEKCTNREQCKKGDDDART